MFEDVAPIILEFIGDSDLGGFNINNYDSPVLLNEYSRVEMVLEMENRNFFDAKVIYFKMNPRTLSAAYKEYTGTELVECFSNNRCM